MSILKVGIVQQANTSDREANVAKSEAGVRQCVAQGAELVVLQELHCGLYFCQTEETGVFDQGETIPGPSTRTFGALALDLCAVADGRFDGYIDCGVDAHGSALPLN